LVALDIQQEVSQASAAASGANPDISRTAIKSNMIVKSGETMVLGGLITDRYSDGNGGIPGLSRIPILGAAFGEQRRSIGRQEVLVLITPTVISNVEEGRAASLEIFNRMSEMQHHFGVAPAKTTKVTDLSNAVIEGTALPTATIDEVKPNSIPLDLLKLEPSLKVK
jgi:general secretion pathway protein D